MSAKEYLEEAINQASKDLNRLEEAYYNLPPTEREYSSYGWSALETIDALRDAIDNMDSALELFPEYI